MDKVPHYHQSHIICRNIYLIIETPRSLSLVLILGWMSMKIQELIQYPHLKKRQIRNVLPTLLEKDFGRKELTSMRMIGRFQQKILSTHGNQSTAIWKPLFFVSIIQVFLLFYLHFVLDFLPPTYRILIYTLCQFL